MFGHIWLLVIILITRYSIVHPHPDGAPVEACDSMNPIHPGGAQAQTTAPPYTITFSDSTDPVKEGLLDVTIEGINGENFKGFLIQAASDFGFGGELRGEFLEPPQESPDFQRLACDKDAPYVSVILFMKLNSGWAK